MKIQRGDVIIIDFPFTDASGTKVRPALVIQQINVCLKEALNLP